MSLWIWLTLLIFGPNVIVYLIQQALLAYFFKARDLKRRYNAKWALVTGSSSGRMLGVSFPYSFTADRVGSIVAGIGKALATRLADQGLNVVLVAKPDDLLDATHTELQTTYPKLQFRKVKMPQCWLLFKRSLLTIVSHYLKVAVNLSEPGAYLGPIKEATDDIDVQLIFSNAGYILTGFFEKWYAADAGSERSRGKETY